jgi:hypothetical protein
MKRTKVPLVRPYLCDRVHAALVRAGRPVTRSELNFLYLDGHNVCKTADVQDALDALVAEGLATRGEGGPIRGWPRAVVVYRAVGKD